MKLFRWLRSGQSASKDGGIEADRAYFGETYSANDNETDGENNSQTYNENTSGTYDENNGETYRADNGAANSTGSGGAGHSGVSGRGHRNVGDAESRGVSGRGHRNVGGAESRGVGGSDGRTVDDVYDDPLFTPARVGRTYPARSTASELASLALDETALRPPNQDETAAAASEPPNVTTAHAGATNVEADIIATLVSIEAGDYVEAATRAEAIPGALGEHLRRVIARLNDTFVQLQTLVSQAVEEGARPLVASNKLAEATQLLDDQANQLAALSEELSASVTEVASSTENAAQGGHAALEQVQQGIERIGQALDGMNESGAAIEELRDHVNALANSVEPIQDVLTLIRTIADQTNLLALNAAIEAARAGAEGRGFAVVADEVRRLAERTNEAVRDVQARVDTLQAGADRVGASMRDIGQRMSEWRELSAAGQNTLQFLQEVVEQGMRPLQEIARATEEQAQAVTQSAENTEQISRATHAIRDNATQLSVMVSDLQTTLRALRERNAEFHVRLGDRELLELAKGDHVMWVQRLHNMLLGRETLRPGDVVDHTSCRLGRWYYSDVGQALAAHPEFQTLEEPHRRLHQTAARAVEAWNAGRQDEAVRLVQEVVSISQEIIPRLKRLQNVIS